MMLCRYKYIHMEEMLGNVAGARQVFERWMKWEPDHNGWAAFIKVRSLAYLHVSLLADNPLHSLLSLCSG